MNQIVRSWQRHQQRPKYTGPDAVEVEDTKIVLEGEREMAERKKPDTGPHLEHAVNRGPNNPDQNRVRAALPKNQYDVVIRTIKNAPMDRVMSIRHATHRNLKRLGLSRDTSKAVKGVPDASDNQAIGSLITWLDSIEKENRRAVRQLIAIDATAYVRSKG